MMDIKKEIIDLERHCSETDQFQKAEVLSNALLHIAELEKEKINLVGEFAEAECLGEVAKIARRSGYIEQD